MSYKYHSLSIEISRNCRDSVFCLLIFLAPSISNAEIIWRGDFEFGDFRAYHAQSNQNDVYFALIPDYGRPIQYGTAPGQPGWQQQTGDGSLCEIVRTTAQGIYNQGPVRNGDYAVRLRVKNGASGGEDPANEPPAPAGSRRSELMSHLTQINVDNLMPRFSERWIGHSIYVPTDWDDNNYGGGITLHDYKSNKTNQITAGVSVGILDGSWQVWVRSSEIVDPSSHSEVPWQYQRYWTGDYPSSSSWADGLRDFPNADASQAVLSNLNKGKWTDFVWHIKWDGEGSDDGGTGFLELWMKPEDGTWTKVLDVLPRETTRGGLTFNQGIGFRISDGGGWGGISTLYITNPAAWRDATADRVIYHDAWKIGDRNASFAAVSPDGSTPDSAVQMKPLPPTFAGN